MEIQQKKGGRNALPHNELKRDISIFVTGKNINLFLGRDMETPYQKQRDLPVIRAKILALMGLE